MTAPTLASHHLTEGVRSVCLQPRNFNRTANKPVLTMPPQVLIVNTNEINKTKVTMMLLIQPRL